MAAKSAYKILDPTSQSLFQKWLDFLTFVNHADRNKELISVYFFDQFTHSPNYFYSFLRFFEENLLTTKEKLLKKRLALKYLEMLSSLCERFSFFEEKNRLDDLCFSIIEPEKYQEIDRLLMRYKKSSGKVIKNILLVLKNLLKDKNHDAEIKGRYKNIYSIYKKAQKKSNKNVLNLNDIFAFRIILKKASVKECFEVLNLLHDTFLPITDYFKDYISIPRINGYQSLHTGLTQVVPNLDLPIEIQIRTQAMDDFAERGFAAHWIYGQEKKAKLITGREKKLYSYFLSVADPLKDHFIYCFSYQGDMVKLEKGSTVLDFAYQIHTEVGHKAISAIVNGQPQPLGYIIQEGDKIKVVASDDNRINGDSLISAHTKSARRKIAEYLKHSQNQYAKA